MALSQRFPRLVFHGQRCFVNSRLPCTAQKLSLNKLSDPLSSRCLSTATAKAPRNYAPISRTPTPPPAKSADELASSPYMVRRTPSVQLPIYKQLKSGGNRVVVLIKKVDGDRRQLLEDLAGSLGLCDDEIRINPVTQNLELKGDHLEKAKSWLLARGF